MSGEALGYLVISLIALLISQSIVLHNTRRTIDKLTDKLLARSYSEYKSLDKVKEDDASPVREDEPKSWYDH